MIENRGRVGHDGSFHTVWSGQFLKWRLGVFEVFRVKASGEPIGVGEHLAGFEGLTLGLWDTPPTAWHKVKVSLRAERSNLCPNTEIASSLTAPRNDTLVSSAPLFIQSFVSRS